MVTEILLDCHYVNILLILRLQVINDRQPLVYLTALPKSKWLTNTSFETIVYKSVKKTKQKSLTHDVVLNLNGSPSEKDTDVSSLPVIIR